MGVKAKKGQSGEPFTPHPAGTFMATLIDVIDQGIKDVTFQGKTKQQPKMAWRFWCGQEKEDGTPLFLTQGYLTVSVDPKAKARLFAESGLGRKFTPEEEEEFEYEDLIGKDFMVSGIHNKVGENTYCNLSSMSPLPKGVTAPGVPENYVRELNREPEKSRDVRTASVAGTSKKAQAREQSETREMPFSDHDDDDLPWG